MTFETGTEAPELKTIGSGDVALAFEDFNRAFEAYRDSNDRRLQDLERRGATDVLTEEKLARIDHALDEAKGRIDGLILRSRRPVLGQSAEDGVDGDTREHKSAFVSYVRTGDAQGLKRLEEKALSAGSGPDGGYLVPANAEREILTRMAAVSPIRSIASVRAISTSTFKKAYAAAGPASGWVAEAANRTQTNSQTLGDLSFPAMEIYAMPAATQTLLDDVAVDVEQWIAEEVETVFAEKEGEAFVKGDGTAKPKGFLSYDMVANASWTAGKVGYVATGADGAFPTSASSDVLIDLTFSLKSAYRQNGTFVMSRSTQSAIRKFRDGQGNYLWLPPASIGAQATLMNFPVVEAEDMPGIAANAFAIAFGDFRRGYLVVDRTGIRVLRDPYSAKPYVLFYTTKRVGGGIQDFEAIKVLKFAAS
jgi:HK97 family phage major capsid protein